MTRNRLIMFTCGAALLGVISRLFQLIVMTEANTGFILKQYSAFSTAITVFIFVLIASVCLAASLTKIKGLKPYATYPSLFVAVAVLAGIALVLEPLTLNYYKTLPLSVRIVCIVLSALSAVVMVLFAVSKTGRKEFNNIYLCVIIFCQFMRLVLAFMSTSKIVTVNDNIYELGFLCAAVMFFVYFAQCHTNSGNERTPAKMLTTGVCSACFAAISALPKVVTLIIGRSELFYNGTSSVFTDITLGLLIFLAALEVKE
ncbi:MAG: hypothetical protein IJN65_03680 [Clostridia bacterium]|nr:hypothetical protein [Clostridia bacterium]